MAGRERKKRDAKPAPAPRKKKSRNAPENSKSTEPRVGAPSDGGASASNLATTPKRVVDPAENFGASIDAHVRFMDSPFVDFCNGMLSPITPSSAKGKSLSGIMSGMVGSRSPALHGNWTPDLMAMFSNGKGVPSGDFLADLNGSLFQQDGGVAPVAHQAVAEEEEKKTATKKKKKTSKSAKNETKAAGRQAQNKLSPTTTTTPKQPKNPSRMLDFGGVALTAEADPAPKVASPETPGTQGAPAATQAKPSKRRRAGSCAERCNCKKSKCLKLYCECFAGGRFCSADCLCKDCGNTEWNKKQVEETRKAIQSRDPLAFQPTILSGQRHKKGCHCKRSHCLKKYCECFQAGIKCSELCKCEDCHNKGTGPGPNNGNAKGQSSKVKKDATAKATKKEKVSIGSPGVLLEPAWKGWTGPSLLKRVAPSTPSQKKAVFQIRGSILRPPPSPFTPAVATSIFDL